MFPETIQKQDIAELPLLKFSGEIRMVTEESELDQVLSFCADQEYVGFDTEKKPTFRKGQYHPTALVQLATHDVAFLIRLNKTGLHQKLINFFESEALKIGISIHDDIAELRQMKEFEPQNFLDLNNITAKIGIKSNGVRNLSAIVLNQRISKNQQISNWEHHTLSTSQQIYAATDAWICAEIYKELKVKGSI